MTQSLAHAALIVRDYDEAIAWFTAKLGFTLVADEHQPGQDKRWVLVAPPGAGEGAASLLLARASTPEQERFIGNQAGGRVFLFLRTDDFDRAMKRCSAAAYASFAGRPSTPTARSPCSRTSTATCGIWCSSPDGGSDEQRGREAGRRKEGPNCATRRV
jgi:catechol 2,3-dioxygenase-like lactoylglutathione lyase family enzyme